MEVPSPAAGMVQAINVKIGDKIKQGDFILTLESNEAVPESAPVVSAPTPAPTPAPPPASVSANTQIIRVPDIGNFDKVDVIEIPIQVGMSIKKNQNSRY